MSPGREATSRGRCHGWPGPCLAIGISSDMLYPSYQQRQIVELLGSVGLRAGYAEIDSPHGHDAFLINLDQLVGPLADFLEHRKLP